MDASDRVSVVALVVSLVALLVTLLQALQQYFATAEGYRNCAASVVGPWHKTRRRRFVPSEFRFETIYEAPLIRLLSPAEASSQRARSPGMVHMLLPRDTSSVGRASGLLRETVHPSRHQVEPWYQPRWVRGASKTITDDYDHEKSVESREVREAEAEAEAAHSVAQDDDASLVSWIFFLRELHQAYHHYWPRQCPNCKEQPEGSKAKSEHRELRRARATSRDEASCSDPVVIQKTIHWDFLGGGITRPVAMTTVGDIIGLALRMGMQWRTIEPENGKMQAVGNGYSLASTTTSRGGLMLTFTAAGTDHSRISRLIPSVPADKLLFGILPGDPTLVKRDFHMVGLRGHIGGARAILAGIAASKGIEAELADADLDLGHKFLKTDFTKLLCPFLPLEGSALATIRFAGWPRHRAFSLLHFWESRLALLQALHREVTHRVAQGDAWDSELLLLQQLKDRLDTLKGDYHQDFHCLTFTPSQAQLPMDAVEEARKMDFLRTCRSTVDLCTAELEARHWGLPAGDLGPDASAVVTRYVLLVAAHSYVAKQAIEGGDKDFEAAGARLKREKGGQPSRRDWAEVISSDMPPEGEPSGAINKMVPSGSPRFWFRMRHIVQSMKHSEKGLRRELSQRFRVDVDADEDEQELADARAAGHDRVPLEWWLMMVRGIACDMACYREQWPEDWSPVRSEFYGDQTPVMLA